MVDGTAEVVAHPFKRLCTIRAELILLAVELPPPLTESWLITVWSCAPNSGGTGGGTYAHNDGPVPNK